jgi:hypothetical protein
MSSPSDPPPTLDISLPGLRASATYFVRVEIARVGLLWPELKRETEVGFRPYNSVYSLTPLLPTRTSATAMLAAECLDPQKRIRYESPWLPKHSPSLQVELNIPCPAALTPGEPLDIALVVFPSESLLEQLAIIRLRSLHIGLRASTTVQVGTLSSTLSSHVRIFPMAGDLVILSTDNCDGPYLLDSAMLNGQLAPRVLLTFGAAGISRQYALEAIAGFSSGERKNIEVSSCVRIALDSEIVNANCVPSTLLLLLTLW